MQRRLQPPRTYPKGCAGIVNEKLTIGQVLFELLASPVIQMREWHLVRLASRKLQSTAIGEDRRQLAVNCKWEGSVLPNVGENWRYALSP